MGLFDRILKRGKDSEKGELAAENPSIVEEDIIDKAIAERTQSIHLKNCLTIPLGDMAALGAGFASMLPGMRQVIQTVTTNGVGYIPINNLGGESLKAFRKATPHIYAGTFDRGGKAVMAKFVKAPPQTLTTAAVRPIDPLTLVMAAMLVSVGNDRLGGHDFRRERARHEHEEHQRGQRKRKGSFQPCFHGAISFLIIQCPLTH